jgi:hypothetical protein
MPDLMPVFMFLWLLWLLDRAKAPAPPKPAPKPQPMTAAQARIWLPFYIDIAAARGDQGMVDHYRRRLAAAQKETV